MDSEANQLVATARKGDRAAADALIELFYERVYAFLRRLAGSEVDAADLTQQTFSRVWQALDGFEGRSSVSSWIHGIAYHVYVDWRRKWRPGEARSDDWWNSRYHSGPGPDETAARVDLDAIVFAAVDQLEPELRETIHLHYYQELSLRETAEAMSIATSTVKYRLRQALGRLQKRLEEERLVKG